MGPGAETGRTDSQAELSSSSSTDKDTHQSNPEGMSIRHHYNYPSLPFHLRRILSEALCDRWNGGVVAEAGDRQTSDADTGTDVNAYSLTLVPLALSALSLIPYEDPINLIPDTVTPRRVTTSARSAWPRMGFASFITV